MSMIYMPPLRATRVAELRALRRAGLRGNVVLVTSGR